MMFRNILFWILSFILLHKVKNEVLLKDTWLKDFPEYIENVLQIFINDLEDDGLCQIRMPDFTQDLDESYYGLVVKGKAHYSNGFVVSIAKTRVKNPPKQRLYNSSLITAIEATYTFDDITIAYDLVAELTTGVLKATGLYFIDGCSFNVTISNNMKTNTKHVFVEWLDTDGNFFERIRFMPRNDITTIIGRSFNSATSHVSDGIRGWNKTFIPYLEKVVKEKIKYPDINYDTKLIKN